MAEEQPPTRNKKIRTPANDLDFNIRLIEPAWGKDEVSQNFQDRLTEDEYVYDKDGNQLFDAEEKPLTRKNSMWDSLGFITKDFRQGNLSRGDIWKGIPNEIGEVVYWAELAGDFESVGYKRLFIACLRRAGIRTESSLSINGMFMKNVNTFRQETKSESREIPQRKLAMGMQK